MGSLISSQKSGDKDPANIFLDFENATVSEDEKQVFDALAAVLDKSVMILTKRSNFQSGEELIKKAVITPGAETEEAARHAVELAVKEMTEFYEFSLELESCFPQLLVALCKNDPKAHIAQQQALAKQLADVFNFVIQFDDLQIAKPLVLQNMFYYYRRALNRSKLAKKDINITIRSELECRMSLLFAYPTPMMNAIYETTVNFLSQDATVPRNHVTLALATMANICSDMVERKKFESEATNMFCLRAMTVSIILFDQLHAKGAFSKNSPIHIKNCVTVLKNHTTNKTDGLLNALRYNTVHLNDAETPASILRLLD